MTPLRDVFVGFVDVNFCRFCMDGCCTTVPVRVDPGRGPTKADERPISIVRTDPILNRREVIIVPKKCSALPSQKVIVVPVWFSYKYGYGQVPVILPTFGKVSQRVSSFVIVIVIVPILYSLFSLYITAVHFHAVPVLCRSSRKK